MMRQYYNTQRCRGGNNPLRVGVLAVGAVFYIQDENYVRSRHGEAAICRARAVQRCWMGCTEAALLHTRGEVGG